MWQAGLLGIKEREKRDCDQLLLTQITESGYQITAQKLDETYVDINIGSIQDTVRSTESLNFAT